ncbi:MAG: response regulator transcription factor [Phycisphaerae bacterium]|nr:response regulator transcription factor [Phycisphaerae bacterium]
MQASTTTPKRDTRTRVLIVDDHQLCREGLRAQLESEINFVVVGEAADAEEGFSQALQHKPDVVLMDIDMPGVSCFDVIRRIREQLPGIKVIIVSGYKNDEQISQAIGASTEGYAVKDKGFEEVRNAIKDVMAGKIHYDPEVLDRIDAKDGQLRLGERPQTRLSMLTPRELELFVLLGQGYSLKRAALAMHIHYKTADKHKVHLMQKLGIHDRGELIHKAIREGIVQP